MPHVDVGPERRPPADERPPPGVTRRNCPPCPPTRTLPSGADRQAVGHAVDAGSSSSTSTVSGSITRSRPSLQAASTVRPSARPGDGQRHALQPDEAHQPADRRLPEPHRAVLADRGDQRRRLVRRRAAPPGRGPAACGSTACAAASPLSASHSRRLSSRPALTSPAPPGRNTTASTPREWPSKRRGRLQRGRLVDAAPSGPRWPSTSAAESARQATA